MFIAKNNDQIILSRGTREELEQAVQFMVYTSIEEVEEEYIMYNGSYMTKAEIVENKQAEFEAEFFNTSLGYIRRTVTMADGSKKDFLSDLLPTISMALQSGTAVSVIAYTMPDFTEEEIDWTKYQEVKTVTAQFIQECFLVLSNDFKPQN